MTKIKICGLKRIEDIYAVNEYKPDYIGFVFAEGRKRTVTPKQAENLKAALSNGIKTVGVFLNNDIGLVTELANAGITDLIQLHGDEDEDYIDNVRKKTSVPIIRSVRVRNTNDILEADKLCTDYLLLDTFVKGIYGGTGETFDWSIIPPLKKPFFLAGGLNTGNISDALGRGAYCLDVSSGAETNGVKDKKKICELIKIVRSE